MMKETHHPPLMGLNHTARYAKAPYGPTSLEYIVGEGKFVNSSLYFDKEIFDTNMYTVDYYKLISEKPNDPYIFCLVDFLNEIIKINK